MNYSLNDQYFNSHDSIARHTAILLYRAKVCFFDSGFRVGVCVLCSEFRDKVFLSLAQVSTQVMFLSLTLGSGSQC